MTSIHSFFGQLPLPYILISSIFYISSLFLLSICRRKPFHSQFPSHFLYNINSLEITWIFHIFSFGRWSRLCIDRLPLLYECLQHCAAVGRRRLCAYTVLPADEFRSSNYCVSNCSCVRKRTYGSVVCCVHMFWLWFTPFIPDPWCSVNWQWRTVDLPPSSKICAPNDHLRIKIKTRPAKFWVVHVRLFWDGPPGQFVRVDNSCVRSIRDL